MAAHVHMKNEFKEEEKYHNLMTWPMYSLRIIITPGMCGYWGLFWLVGREEILCVDKLFKKCLMQSRIILPDHSCV